MSVHVEYCLECDFCKEFWPDDGNADWGPRERRAAARADGWTRRNVLEKHNIMHYHYPVMMDLCRKCSQSAPRPIRVDGKWEATP